MYDAIFLPNEINQQIEEGANQSLIMFVAESAVAVRLRDRRDRSRAGMPRNAFWVMAVAVGLYFYPGTLHADDGRPSNN